MADSKVNAVDLLPEGFTIDKPKSSGQSAADLLPEGFTIDEPKKKGSYFSGDQGLVPDVAENIGKGIVSGIISVPQGIAELGAIGIDGALGTRTGDAVTKAFEYIKPDAEGVAGEVTEDLVAFGVGFIPVVGWLGRAGQAASTVKKGGDVTKLLAGRGKFGTSAVNFGASKVGRQLLGSKKGMIGSTAVGALGYSTAVASDGQATLSDNFDVLPDFLETEEADSGLTGRQEAARRFRNKLRVGVEDMFISGAVDTALTAGGAGIKALGGTETGAKVAKAVRAAPAKVGQAVEPFMGETAKKGVKNVSEAFTKYFTPSGGADTVLYETVQDGRSVADMSERRGVKAREGFGKAAKNFLKKADLKGKPKVEAQKVEVALYKFLMGDRKPLEAYGDEGMIKAADKMIDVRMELQDNMIRQLETEIGFEPGAIKQGEAGMPEIERILKEPSDPGKQKAARALQEIMQNQADQQGYMRRMFEQYTNPVKFYRNLDLDSPDFKNAVDEIMRHTGGTEQAAKEVVYKTLALDVGLGATPEQALKRQREAIESAARGDKITGVMRTDKPVLTAMDDIFVPREELLDASPSLQKLKGRLTDVYEVYDRTISDMAQANAAADMYRSMKDQGLVTDLAQAEKIIAQGGRPSIVDIPNAKELTPEEYARRMQEYEKIARDEGIGMSVPDPDDATSAYKTGGDQVRERLESRLIDEGYVRLGDERSMTHVFGGSYGDLTGKLVSPEAYSALTQPLRLGNSFAGEVVGVLSQMRALSQKMTIVPNPAAQVRNISGNMLMLAANSNLGRTTDFSDMFKIYAGSLKDLDDAGLERLAKKISLSGVEDTSLVVRALKEYQKAGEDLVGTSAKLAKYIDVAQNKIPFMKQFERVYGDSDSFFKGLALVAEEQKILAAFNKAGVKETDPDVFEDFIAQGLAKRLSSGVTEFSGDIRLKPHEIMAADAVKDTMPIYPRIGKAVRALDMVPIFGNFTSFASENIRNSVNIVDRGLREMAYTASPKVRAKIGDAAADALEKELRGQGAQRLTSYMATATIGPGALVKASMTATGTTPEQMEALKAQLPEYMDGHQLVILSNDGKGNIQYIDLSYVSPYAFALDPARAALQVYKEQGKLDKSQIERLGNGMLRGLTMFAEPFGEESLIFERLRDVLPAEGITSFGVGRGGKNQDGVSVYSGVDSAGDKLDKSIGHIFNGIIPSYVAQLATVDQPFGALRGDGPRSMLDQGRVGRAITGTPGKRGEEYNTFTEAARLVTGFTPMKVDLKNDLQFTAKEYTPKRTEAKSNATKIMKRGNATMGDMTRAWGDYLDNLYREQSNLYKNIQNARELMPNLSYSQREALIRNSLITQGKMGRAEADMIMQGKFYPTEASKELYKDVQRMRQAEGRTFMTKLRDFDEFQKMSRDRIGESLGVDYEPSTSAPAPAPNAMDLLPKGFTIDQPTTAPSASDQLPPGFTIDESSLPMPSQPVQTASAQVNPIVLGNDPATQALAKALGRA